MESTAGHENVQLFVAGASEGSCARTETSRESPDRSSCVDFITNVVADIGIPLDAWWMTGEVMDLSEGKSRHFVRIF